MFSTFAERVVEGGGVVVVLRVDVDGRAVVLGQRRGVGEVRDVVVVVVVLVVSARVDRCGGG